MIAIMRRGGRARLKASDSKSDRGVSPSGVQILSPPPIVLASERLRRAPALDGRADNPRGLFWRTRGGVTERPKVRHWKCRARVIPVPRVQIPPPPPTIFPVGAPAQGSGARRSGSDRRGCSGARRSGGDRRGWLWRPTVGEAMRSINSDVAVLDGELAVPCDPQSASAGSNSHSEGGPC